VKKSLSFLAVALFAAVSPAASAQANPRVYTPQFDNERRADDIPDVQVWLDERSYSFGDFIRPHVASDTDAYITVVRVSSDGALQVLYPQYPGEQERYQPSRFVNDRLPVNTTNAFMIRESRGVGFVFAIASYYKFNYRYYTSGRNWSTSRLASASRFGSPFQIVRSFVDEVTEGSDSYSMDYVMYDVNFDQYRSRYASRFRGYAYDDYYDLCLGAFGNWYSSYCRGYSGYGYPYIVVTRPSTPNPSGGKNGMRMRPLVHDPVVGGVPQKPDQPAEGILPPNTSHENAAVEAARRERLLRSAGERSEPVVRPRSEPTYNAPRAEPRSQPRSEPRPEPRSEPRMAPPPQRDAPRAAPVVRSEPRVERPRSEAPAPRVERAAPAKKDN
jgi:hypothetical protein